MASSPTPPIPFEDHCAIVHNDTLYVYQPNAFQTLKLADGAQWQQESNGVAVTGGLCVKGGIEGDKNRPALYVVGGATSNSTYPGLQFYSIEDKSWTTITPQVKVTAQRQNHGAAYLNASSALIVYGGSQDGNAAGSADTFLMLMYAPYVVQSYTSTAGPAVRPHIHSWDNERAVMVGGSATTNNVFLFDPTNGWQDQNFGLPEPLPDQSVARTSLLSLDDNSKILLTYRMNQSPNVISRNLLWRSITNVPPAQGESVGDPSTNSTQPGEFESVPSKRSIFIQSYPTYNATGAPSTVRTNFAVAQGSNEIAAIVGGDTADSTTIFGTLDNKWISADSVFGEQIPVTSSTPSPTASATKSATPSASTSAAPAPPAGDGPNTLAILGGVLGGICGLAALLIILLLWLRHKRRARARAAAGKSPNPEEGKNSFEGPDIVPLAQQGQPMGRSPVASAVMDGRDSTAFFNSKFNEKALEAGAGNRTNQAAGSGLMNKNPFIRQQSPLTISKPMAANLGDYKERPSIELGKATPVGPVQGGSSKLNMVTNALPEIDVKQDQRKTDEGWAAYFQSFQTADDSTKRDTVATATSSYTNTTQPSRSGKGGFWPGSGVPEPKRSPRSATFRDADKSITTNTVAAASPTLQVGPSNPKTLTMSTAEGIPAKISRAESVSTTATDEDDDYEDDRLSAYSSGVPHVAQHTSWTPFGNGSSSHVQTVIHTRSSNTIAPEFGPATTISNETSNSGTTKSSIPVFPMPAATIRRVQPSGELQPPRMIDPSEYRTSEDYFGKGPHPDMGIISAPPPASIPAAARTSYQRPQPPTKPATGSSDMSWINLGTPNQ